MAYKKYIKRGGKVYGPYIYHSRRIDGKVISEYRGQEKLSYKKIFLAVFGVIFLAAFISILIFSEKEITGQAVFDLDAKYQQGIPLEGKLRLSLQEGEFLPIGSKIIFENNRSIFQYNLSEVVSEEPILTSAGKGYGIPGEKEIFPIVDFILIVESEIFEENETVFVLEEISGLVSAEESFIYILKEEETNAELKPLSVGFNGEKLPDNTLNVDINGSEVIVTTEYSEFEWGFGEEYLGGGSKELIIDVSNLGLILEQGNLKISIIDSDQEIISLSTLLEEGDVDANEIILDEPILDEPIESMPEIPETELTDETSYEIEETEIYVPELVVSLTEQERAVLIEKFGNTLKVKEALPKRGFIKVRYEFSLEYWVEFNYDSNLSREILESFMDRDRTKWLKDVATSLSEEPESEEKFNESEIPI